MADTFHSRSITTETVQKSGFCMATFRLVCCVFLTLAPAWATVVLGSAEQAPALSHLDRAQVLRIFKTAIGLNEAFKAARTALRKGLPEEYLKKRQAVETYHDEVLTPRIKEGVRLLSSGNDRELGMIFFQLLISYENSADEELSSALGELFLHNPSLVEATLENFSPAEQADLCARLGSGWEYVTHQNKRIARRKIAVAAQRLKRLELRLCTQSRETLLQIFKTAIALNEAYRHEQVLEELQKKREAVEHYREGPLDSGLDDVTKLLSNRRDQELALTFFQMLLSYRNSPDIRLSYALGEVFLDNPELVEGTFTRFSKSEQVFLYDRLVWGWEYMISQARIPPSRLKAYEQRLKALEAQVKRP